MAAIETKGDSRSRSKGGGAGSLNVVFERTTRRGRERVREVFTGRKVASLSATELEHAHRAGWEPDGEYPSPRSSELHAQTPRNNRGNPREMPRLLRGVCA